MTNIPVSSSPLDLASLPPGRHHHRFQHGPVGCDACKGAGYHGRTGVYELVVIDEDMRTMIHDGASEQDLDRHARKASQSIRADGRRRVLAGETTLEEVLRVTRED